MKTAYIHKHLNAQTHAQILQNNKKQIYINSKLNKFKKHKHITHQPPNYVIQHIDKYLNQFIHK